MVWIHFGGISIFLNIYSFDFAPEWSHKQGHLSNNKHSQHHYMISTYHPTEKELGFLGEMVNFRSEAAK